MTQQLFTTTLRRATWIAAGSIVLGLGSCTAPTGEADLAEDTVASGDTLQVVTTILPITQFTTAVAGDRAEVTQLLPTNTGPHDYQAKPTDVQALINADVLVKNGLDTELFLDDMIENAENAELAIIDSSEGVATLESSGEHDHGHSEDEDHSEEDHSEEDHSEEEHSEHDHSEEEHSEHDHSEEDHAEGDAHAEEHSEHAHGEFDPHIWLDPKRAVEQVENIRDGLIAADPEGEAEYTTNAEAFIAELTALDADISKTLSPFEGETFVIVHDFASYFADSYGLQFESLVGIPEESPSPEDVKRVIDTVETAGLKTILAEPQSNKGAFEAITNDLGIGLGVFDPMETGDATAIQPGYYIETMRQNAENLAAGFESSD